MCRENVVHTYVCKMQYDSVKGEILPFVTTWMDLKVNMLSEIGQTGKDKYCMILLLCEI